MQQGKPGTKKFDIVAIHGVGDRQPGEVLSAVTSGLSNHYIIHTDESNKWFGGHSYPYTKVHGHPFVDSVLEVNWDDVSHPARSIVQYVTHFISLIASILRIAEQPIGSFNQRSKLASFYRSLFNAAVIWCVYLPIVTIGSFSPTKSVQITWVLSTCLFVVVLTTLFKPYDHGFRAGYWWAAGIFLVGIASIVNEGSRTLSIQIATFIYSSVQGLAGTVLVGAMLVAWIEKPGTRGEQRLAKLAELYLPFAIISGIGALVWAGTLIIGNTVLSKTTVLNWSAAYLAQLKYDLAFSEALLATSVGLGGFLLLLPIYPLFRDQRSGGVVHAHLLIALKGFALIVFAVFALFLFHLPVFFKGGQYAAFNAWIKPLLFGLASDSKPAVFEIYLASALRLLPFLAYFLGPFRVMLDTIGDIALYVDPEGRQNSDVVSKKCRDRLHGALEIVYGEERCGNGVLVVAHSQGTTIAADVLSSFKRNGGAGLITMGSPISSLYWRLIGKRSVSVPQVPWLNLYRTGDYIAGGAGIKNDWSASHDVEDVLIGDGGHTGYFQGPEVWEAIGSWVCEKLLNDNGHS